MDEASYVALQIYSNVRHLPGVSLTDYRTSFKLCIKNLIISTHPKIPSPAEQVRHFIVRQDNKKCRESLKYIAWVNQGHQMRIFQRLFKMRVWQTKFFVPLVRVRPNNPYSMVFSVEFTGICYSCGKDGHRASNCRSRKRVDEKKKRKKETVGRSQIA